MDGDWLRFALSAAGVIGAGILIGRVTGEVGDRLRLGRAWAGAVLLSFATTLPELVTTITVTARGFPGLALGNVLGSILFNLLILVVIDLMGPKPFYHRVSLNHVATGLLGCSLLGLVIAGVALGYAQFGGPAGIGLGPIGVTSLAILLMYGLGQYALFRMARASYQGKEVKLATPFDRWSIGRLLLAYLGLVGVILVAATNLGVAAEALTIRYHLGATFAGATLLGIVTSLPEITNGIACARQQEFDLAVGNVLGANAFVVVVLVVADAVIAERFFSVIGQSEALSAIAMAALAIVMQTIALGALAVRSTDRVWRISVASFLLAGLYAASLVIAYHFGVPTAG